MTWKGARAQGCQVCSCQGTYPNRTRASTRCIALALTQEVFQQASQDPLGRKIREGDAWFKLNNACVVSFVQVLTLFQWTLLLKKSANPVSIRESGTSDLCHGLATSCQVLEEFPSHVELSPGSSGFVFWSFRFFVVNLICCVFDIRSCKSDPVRL